VIGAAAPEAVGHACPHVSAPAHAHAALRHHVLLVCTLKQRFSGVHYSRSSARSRSASVASAARVAGPDVAAATVLPGHGITPLPFSTFSLSLTTKTPFVPALDEVRARLVPSLRRAPAFAKHWLVPSEACEWCSLRGVLVRSFFTTISPRRASQSLCTETLLPQPPCRPASAYGVVASYHIDLPYHRGIAVASTAKPLCGIKAATPAPAAAANLPAGGGGGGARQWQERRGSRPLRGPSASAT
jgi:hypothetical protein